MAFRIVEISEPAEVHIRSGQLEIAQENGTALIPVEDVMQIMTIGPGIRLSTMDLSILSQNRTALTTLDEKYLPTAIVLPFEGNARQSQLIHLQVEYDKEDYLRLWTGIIRRKIENQARALTILGLTGAGEVLACAGALRADADKNGRLPSAAEVDTAEAQAARVYFQHYHEGLNRRSSDPVNSRLNYGYAVIRSAIARSLTASGFHPAFGIHHNSQLNAFNLVDDLIEPFRPAVDLAAHANIGTSERLSRAERREMAAVLFHACISGGAKTSIASAIELMAESLKRIIGEGADEELALPTVVPTELLESVTE